jgi:DNA-binding CsgD family transcriptional regulator
MDSRRAVGRDGELAEVTAFLDAIGNGFAALALEGDAGIGKTTVWREGIGRAEERGMLVLSCRAARAEAKLSFAGLADLLEPVDDGAFAELPAPQRGALEVALLRAAPTRQPIDPRTVAAGVLSLLRAIAAKTTLVLAIDDAPWLDRSSRQALEFVARRLAGESIGLFFTLRSEEPGPPFLGEIAGERLTSLALGGLSLAALGRIIAGDLGRPLPRPMLVRITQACAGNPFYALEIARLALERGTGAGEALPVPDDLRTLARARVQELPAVSREALLRAAALSAPDTQLVDVAALAPAEEADLVRVDAHGRIEFSHPLFASAVYVSANAAQRQEVHRQLATAVEDPEQRARHLALGEDGPSEAIAADLDAAAGLSRSRGSPDAAADLAELALRQTSASDTAGRSRRLIAAARFQLDAGDLDRAEHLLGEELSGEEPSGVRAQTLELLGQLQSRRSSFEEALRVALEARDAAVGNSPLLAVIELEIAFYRFSLGDFPGAAPHARASAQLAEEADQDGLLSDALAALVAIEFLCGNGFARPLLERALELQDPERTGPLITHPRFVAGMIALWTGRLTEARDLLGEMRADVIARGEEGSAPLLFLYLVWACLWQGDLSSGDRYARELLEVSDLTGDPMTRAVALCASALVHAPQGHIELARQESLGALELFGKLGWQAGQIWGVWALGFTELSCGNETAVDAALGPVAQAVTAQGLADPVIGVFLPDEIEALISLGEHDRATSLIEPLEQRGRELDRPWALAVAARSRGALAAANGQLEIASGLLDEAVAQHERVAMPFELARTLLVAGQVLRRRKKRREAADTLTRALGLFEEIGTPLWAERARSELSRTGVRTSGGDELTATERRVAELAASGLSNKEIADRAFLSVKAVEGNLTRAYRKLGIRSRVRLAAALQADAQP